MIIWLIGLSGAGKTTLGKELHHQLHAETRHLLYLDGDEFREIFRNDVDHTIEGRRKNAERISHFCKVLDQQNIHVIASVLSIFPEWQEWNRKNFSKYFEIYLKVPINVLAERDPKDLYQKAQAGEMDNVVGIDIPFPEPLNPDLIIDHILQESGIKKTAEFIRDRLPPLD